MISLYNVEEIAVDPAKGLTLKLLEIHPLYVAVAIQVKPTTLRQGRMG